MSIDIIAGYDDQLNSQYDVILDRIPGSSYDTSKVSFRHTGSFEVPEQMPNVYQVFFKGRSRTKVGGKDESSKEFSMDFRVDQEWDLQGAFEDWKKLTYDTTNIRKGLENEITTTLYVRFLDGNDVPKKTAKFSQVKLKSYKLSNFDYSQGEPTILTANFIYGRVDWE